MRFPKIYLCCGHNDLRPEFSYAKITKEDTVATNAYIILWHKTSEIFKEDFVESLPDNGIMIHINALRAICKTNTIKLSLTDNKEYIVLHQKDGSEIRYNCQPDNNYPEWKNLFNKSKNAKPISKIGIKPALLDCLCDAMDTYTRIVELEFTDERSGILVSQQVGNYLSAKGLIMPAMINNY